jgi:cytochrome b involved in lipid metabolism
MVVKRLIYTAFIAFLASAATIGILAYLAPRPEARSAPDEAVIRSRELARHAGADDCWIAIDGAVYDLTAYIPLHPASPDLIASWCGKDATQAFATKGYGQPHSATAQAMLSQYFIGRLGKD